MACHLDFRFLDEGLGGARGKNKRRRDEAADMLVDEDEPRPSKLPAVPAADGDPNKPSFGRPTYDGVIAGKESGRRWKQVRTQRSSAIAVSRRARPLEVRKREKELKRAYQERMKELKDEIRNNKIEKRKRREEKEKKKQENVLRSGTKLQKITNPNTLKKIAKSRDKKLLKVVPDELLDKNKGHTNKGKK